ncbi:MAG: YceI family protein [Acidobacteriaceae bacterium]
MKKFSFSTRLLSGLVLLTAFSAMAQTAAQTTKWQIDPAHSDALFSIRHMGIANVHGSFSQVTGTVMFDEKNIAASSVDATIDTGTVNTDNTMRDKDLKGPNFFDVAKFPTMHFVSSKLANEGGQLKLYGNLTMHGVTRPVILNMDPVGKAQADPWGKTRRGFTASTTLNRKDFGLVWNGMLKSGDSVVADDAKITLEIESTKM